VKTNKKLQTQEVSKFH